MKRPICNTANSVIGATERRFFAIYKACYFYKIQWIPSGHWMYMTSPWNQITRDKPAWAF